MSIPLATPVKPFASLKHVGGIPHTEQVPMLGAPDTTPIGTASVPSDANIRLATALGAGGGTPISRYYDDQIDIDIIGVEDKAWSFSIDAWDELTAVMPGDVLVDGDSALVLEGTYGSLNVGKSEANRLLFSGQDVRRALTAASHGDVSFRFKALRYEHGLLNRRLSLFEDSHSVPVVFEQRSATKPLNPVGVVLSFGHPSPGLDGWVRPGSTVGTATLWVAHSRFHFDHTLQEWILDGWTVVQAESSQGYSTVQYSLDGGDTWVDALPAGTVRYRVRIRGAGGAWQEHPIGERPGWHEIASLSLLGDGMRTAVSATGLEIDPEDYRWFIFELQRGVEREDILVPTVNLQGRSYANRTARTPSGVSYRCHWDRRGEAYATRSNQRINDHSTTDVFDCFVNFYTDENSPHDGQPPWENIVAFSQAPSTGAATFRLWGL